MPGVVVATPRTLGPPTARRARRCARREATVLQWGDGDGGLRPGAHRHPAARRDHPAQPDANDRGARVPRGDRLAPPAHPLELLRVRRARPRPRQEPDARRARAGRPGRALVTQLRRVDAGAVRHCRDRRDPRQHQPRLPHPRAGVRAQPVGMPLDHRRPRVQDVAIRGDGVRGRRGVPGAGAGGVLLDRRVEPSHRGRRDGVRRGARRAARRAAPRRPDQHPVHVGHDRVPQGRHAHAPQHPQQRLLHDRAAGLHPPATGCASPCPSTTASAW